jgi:hypothetical protein
MQVDRPFPAAAGSGTLPSLVMTTYRRPVSTIEKIYLAFDRARPTFANQLVVEGVGKIDATALAAASARAAEANPGACLGMRGILGRTRWEPVAPPRVHVIRDARWDGRSEDRAFFLDRRLDRRGPSCEIQLIETATRSFLIFRSLHAVMDGLGTLLWAQDVMRALRGEAPIGHPSAMTDVEFAAGLNAEPLVLPKRDGLHPCGRADAPTSGNDFRWERVTIDAPADVPVVAALAVTIAQAARRHGDGPVRFNIPADLRFFHQEERSTGNVIGTLFVDVAAGATVDDVARDLKARLKAKEHARRPRHYLALRWLPMGAYEGAIAKGFLTEHESGRYGMSATISFLGAVEAATVAAPGFAPTAAFWIPPMADQTCFVAVSKLGGRLELMLALPRVLATRGRFEALRDELVATLSFDSRSLSASARSG